MLSRRLRSAIRALKGFLTTRIADPYAEFCVHVCVCVHVCDNNKARTACVRVRARDVYFIVKL